MFTNSDRDRKTTLGEMRRNALNLCNGNQIEAEQKMVEFIRQDARFHGLDPAKLVKRVAESWSNGAKLDLEANDLKPGQRSWADSKHY
jgi:hypothetical protein